MNETNSKINDILNTLNIKIETIGGFCPVQAYGTILKTKFYFRARGQAYSLRIGKDPVGIPKYCEGWHVEKAWGNQEYDAGYMSVSLAKLIIAKHTIDYINDQTTGCLEDANIPDEIQIMKPDLERIRKELDETIRAYEKTNSERIRLKSKLIELSNRIDREFD